MLLSKVNAFSFILQAYILVFKQQKSISEFDSRGFISKGVELFKM